MGWRRLAGHWLLSDYDLALDLGRRALARGCAARGRSGVWHGPLEFSNDGVSLGAFHIHLQHTTGSLSAHAVPGNRRRSEEHTSELQSRGHLVCRLLLEKKNKQASQAKFL